MTEISDAGYHIRLHALARLNCPMSRRDPASLIMCNLIYLTLLTSHNIFFDKN